MKRPILFLLFLFISILSFAQNRLSSMEVQIPNEFGTSDFETRDVYEYDESGNQTAWHLQLWSTYSKKFVPYYSLLKTYDDNNLITSERLSYVGNDVEPEFLATRVDYTYFGDCLNTIRTYNYGNFGLSNLEETYFNPTSCQADSAFYYSYFQGVIQVAFRKDYTYEANKEIIIFTTFSEPLFEFETPQRRMETTTNEEGQILSILDVELFISGEHGSIKYYEYDQHGNKTLESVYAITADYGTNLSRESAFDHQYDEEDQLIQTVESFRSIPLGFSPLLTYDYEYYCDGLLKKKKAFRHSTRTTTLYLYQYQKGHNCETSDSQNTILVRPNITKNYTLVESEILHAQDSYLAVYDLSGRKVFGVAVPERVQNYQLNLGGLSSGYYVIHVFNSKHSASKRILKD